MKTTFFLLLLFATHALAVNTDVRRLKPRDGYLIFDDRVNAKEIVITFSGKINPKTFPEILKRIDEEQIRAHFFLNGDSAIENIQAVNSLAIRNQIIGSQGLSSATSKQQGQSIQTILNEIQTGHEAVFASIGYVYPFIRLAPRQGGLSVREMIKESGAFAFYWNIDYYPENPAQSMRDNLKREGYRGIVAIPLFREDALIALDTLIEVVKEHDLTVVVITPSEESSWLEHPPLVRKQLREEIRENGSLHARKAEEKKRKNDEI